MGAFAQLVRHSRLLGNLTVLSVTIPVGMPYAKFLDGLLDAVHSAPLREFQIWRPGGDIRAIGGLPYHFVAPFLSRHGARLRKFAVQRLETTMDVIKLVCQRCPALEQLFVVLGPCDMVRIQGVFW